MLFHVVVLDRTAAAFLDAKGIAHPGPQKARFPTPEDVRTAALAVGFRIADAGAVTSNSWSLAAGPAFAAKASDFALMKGARTVAMANSTVPCEIWVEHPSGRKMVMLLASKLAEICGPQVLVANAERSEANWKFKVIMPT